MPVVISDEQRDALISAACEARGNAYAPYSNYRVGAAVLAENGEIFTGVNVENATYGLTICAERTAVFKAISEGQQRILAVVVCTENGGSPCGACRQILAEFGSGDIPVWMADPTGNVRESTIYTLLPDHFSANDLDI